MDTVSLRKMTLAAMLVAAALFGAFADDPAYITGAEYVIEGNRLTVRSGEGTLVLQTPTSVSIVCVTNGAALKIGIDNPFASRMLQPDLVVIGGAISNEGDNLIIPLREKVGPRHPVVASELRNDAGLIGAVAMARLA